MSLNIEHAIYSRINMYSYIDPQILIMHDGHSDLTLSDLIMHHMS